MTEPRKAHTWATYLYYKLLYSIPLHIVSYLSGWTRAAHPHTVLRIPSRDPGRDIVIHVYAPPHAAEASGPAPVLLNWHGSGFLIPMHGTDSAFCHRVARDTGRTVLDCPYRLAPDHPFPAAVHDAEDALAYVLARPDRYDASRLALTGFSAGANLALGLACAPPSELRPRDALRGVRMVLFYPPADLSIPPAEKKNLAGKEGTLPARLMEAFNAAYLLPGQDVRDPRISPGAAAVEAFPEGMESLWVTATRDSLLAEAEALAHRLNASGRMATVRRVEGDHGFDKKPKKRISEAERSGREETYRMAVDLLKT